VKGDPSGFGRVGFVGLGNVGHKLAGSLLRNGAELTVRDLDSVAVRPFLDAGAESAASPRELAERSDVVVTCLPTPAASAAVMEGSDGLLAGWRPGTIWMEMSTTEEAEVRRLAALVEARGGRLPGVWRLPSCGDRQHLESSPGATGKSSSGCSRC
jgi:3-hydroxyisobutyrate dehydrogenase